MPTFREWSDDGPVIAGITFTSEPPPQVALVLADAIHDMRATLDYLVYEIVNANGGEPTRWTQFPIYLERPAYQDASATIGKGNIPAAALAVIEALQLFQAGDVASDHPPWKLHELANIEKHRRPFLTSIRMPRADLMDNFGLVRFSRPEGQAVTRTFKFERSLAPDSDVDVYLPGSLFVVLEEEGRLRGAPIGGLQRQIAEFIESRVIPVLEPPMR